MTRLIVLTCLYVACVQAPDPVPKLLQQLKSDKSETRTEALAALADLGPKAKAAIPALANLLPGTDEYERVLAALALGKIGKASLTAVAKLLDHEDENTRYYAVWVIGLIGKDAKEYTPRLLTMFAKDEDEDVRVKTIYALARVAPDSKEALAAFTDLAAKKGTYSPSRDHLAAIAELRHFGSGAIAPLVRAAQDIHVEQPAVESLSHLLRVNTSDAFAQAVVPQIPALSKLYPTHLYYAATSSTEFSLTRIVVKHGAKLLPQLDQQLRDKDRDARLEAARVLGWMGRILLNHGENPTLAREVAKLLAPHLQSPDDRMRLIVAANGPWQDGTEAVLLDFLLDDDEIARVHAFYALEDRGMLSVNLDFGHPAPHPKLWDRYKKAKGDEKLRLATGLCAAPLDKTRHDLLWANVKHKDEAMRHRIACALVRENAGPFNLAAEKRVLPLLLEGLKSDIVERRIQTARTLERIQRSLLADHLPALLDRLADPSPEVRRLVLGVLTGSVVRSANDSKRCLKAIEVMLKDASTEMRLVAMRVISTALSEEDSVPLLVRMAQSDKTPKVWEAACYYLFVLRVNGRADAAVPGLLKAAEDPERFDAAIQSLVVSPPESEFAALLNILMKRDETLRKTIGYPPSVRDGADKLNAALLKDWKRSNLARSAEIAYAIQKIQPLLAYKKRDALVAAALPLISQQLINAQKALMAKGTKERLDAVAALGQLRVLLAGQPVDHKFSRDDAWVEPRHTKELTLIAELLVQARRDSELTVRRQARKWQSVELAPWGGPGFVFRHIQPGE